METQPNRNGTIIYDGSCNLWLKSVRFIQDRATDIEYLRFQDMDEQFFEKYPQIPRDMSSVVYIANDRVYLRSSAAANVAWNFRFPWNCLYLTIIIPPFIRNWGYDIVARNRYQIWGRTEDCGCGENSSKTD